MQASRDISLHRFIYSLGIPEVGESTARNLESHFEKFKGIFEATYDELIEVKDIGPKVAENIIQFFQNFFVSRIDKLILDMEECSMKLVDQLYEIEASKGGKK